MRKKKIVLWLILILIILLSGGLLLWKKTHQNETKIIFVQEQPVVEYGSKQTAQALVKSSDGKIIRYPQLDTRKVGKQQLTYVVEKNGQKKDIQVTVVVQDTKAPKIHLAGKTYMCTIAQPCLPDANIKSVKDPVDGVLPYVDKEGDTGKGKGYYRIVGEVDTTKVGQYPYKVVARDKHGNESSVRFQVEVQAQAKVPTPKDSIQPTYINGILIVNKQFGLPSDFGKTDPTAYAALKNLQAAAKEAGYDMPLLSGYRSYAYQVDLYNAYVARDGKEKADTYSARPGHSEHQSGLAFDIGAIDDAYGETPAGKWLEQHCAEYGFIIRFPKGKEAVTGYQYEPWHVRYVGKTAAKEIMTRGICLEEYLGVAQ